LPRRSSPGVRLTSQELTDVVGYRQDLPETEAVTRTFQLEPWDSGEKLFESKGCIDCHAGVKAPDKPS